MVMVYRNSQMEIFLKDLLKTIAAIMESIGTKMETYIKAIGGMR